MNIVYQPREILVKLTLLSAATAAFVALTATSASALPVAKPGQVGAEKASMSEQVRRRPGHYGQNRWKSNRGYRANRYDRYRGWNRYNSRPYNYRSRGCAAVGPVWFCR